MIFKRKKEKQYKTLGSPVKITFDNLKLIDDIDKKREAAGLSWDGLISELNLELNIKQQLINNIGLLDNFDDVLILLDWIEADDFKKYLKEEAPDFDNLNLDNIDLNIET